jgi:D-glycero-D-manno-heptose 1,7-bisphosphate phosphatase
MPFQSVAQGRFHEDLGMWIWVASHVAREPSPAVFLDRDGVIVEDPGYLCQVSDLKLIPGAASFVAMANRSGIPVIEITNQAGIGRGYYGWKEFLEVEEALASELAREGAALDGVFACPYHRDGIPPWAHPAHPARKPRPGMLLAAARSLSVDLGRSWMVGDKLSDVEAAYNAGLRGGMHVLTGEGAKHRQAAIDWDLSNFELRLVGSIADCTPLLEVKLGHGSF